jgi:hypothetical protein
VETTSFAALFAAGGVAIGVAWSGMLANFAAGVFLVILRPFRVGDFITAGGVTGTVAEIGLFASAIDTPDNVRTIIGNNAIFSGNIQNFSLNPYRRVGLTAQLAGSVDHAGAITLLKEGLAKVANMLSPPAPAVEILEFTLAGPVLALPVLPQRSLLAGVLRHQPADPGDLHACRLPDGGTAAPGQAGLTGRGRPATRRGAHLAGVIVLRTEGAGRGRSPSGARPATGACARRSPPPAGRAIPPATRCRARRSASRPGGCPRHRPRSP